MKILFITRSHIGLSMRGLHLQILKTADALTKLGVEVIFFDPWKNQIREVDICHFFSTFDNMIYHFDEASRLGKPIVYTPILGNNHIPLWKYKLYVCASCVIPGFLTYFKTLKQMFSTSDRIISLNQLEKYRIENIFSQNPSKIRIIPNGMECDFSKSTAELFYEKYGFKDFILNVGTIDPNKNQLTLIKAVQDTPYKLVIIGSAVLGSDGYAETCRKQAGQNVLFTGPIGHADPMLGSAYAAAKIFALPSISEVQPLVFGEAAQAGCYIITSTNVCALPGLEKYTDHVSPNSVGQLRKAISKIMSWSIDVDEIKKTGVSMPSWQDMAVEILKIYRELKQ